MKSLKMIIKRTEFYDFQSLGEMAIYEGLEEVFVCKTLELEEDENRVRDDCIPRGHYTVKKRYSEKFKHHFHIQDVPNRSYILIHSGNYYSQILGSVLVGDSHCDLNKDGYKDVTNSKKTLQKLLLLLPDEFGLLIV